MIHKCKLVIYGPLDDVKTEYANFKCTIRGEFDEELLQNIPQVEQIETINGEAILYLEKDIHPASWLSHLPEQLDIQELSIDRISLHEIFVQIADRKSTRLNSSHVAISYAVFCLKKKKHEQPNM